MTAVALGNFDGVHLAHAALIRKTVQYAREHGLESVVYLLEPHPKSILCPKMAPRLLTSLEEKKEILYALGADRVHVDRRGREILGVLPEVFVKQVLAGELHAKYVAAGKNYHFGKQAAGNAELLCTLCAKEGIACEILDTVSVDGETVSSTRIRKCLANGEIEKVNRLSAVPYTKSGIVEEGKKLGRELGFPTVNVALDKALLPPRRGVYISRTCFDGAVYESVTNVGINPTVETAEIRMESHLLDFEGDVYGKTAAVTLLSFLRPETAFPSLEKLKEQIAKDKAAARQYFK